MLVNHSPSARDLQAFLVFSQHPACGRYKTQVTGHRSGHRAQGTGHRSHRRFRPTIFFI